MTDFGDSGGSRGRCRNEAAVVTVVTLVIEVTVCSGDTGVVTLVNLTFS
jgi:hypothetical protein